MTTKSPPPKAPSKKRKSGDDLDALKASKQPKLDSFFTPRVSLSTTCGAEKKMFVAKLSDEQNKVLRMVMDEGKSVFFTGSAGTGKSLLLRAIISALRKKHANKPDVVSVTASTGMAASNIGVLGYPSTWLTHVPSGMTIHSWGAVTPGNHNIDAQISCIKLVVTGDFFQLPPVCKGEPFFAFESEAWKACIEDTVNLTQVFRQKDDHFVNILNETRQGTISPAALSTFKSLSRPLPRPPPSMPNVLPTELFPLRHEVSSANSARLRALPHTLHTFHSNDTFPGLSKPVSSPAPSSSIHKPAVPNKREGLLSGVLAEKKLELKKGAQVMLVKNIDEILVNGCVGSVVGFHTYREVKCAMAGGTRSTKATGVIRNVSIDTEGGLITVKDCGADKENVEADVDADAKGKSKVAAQEERFPVVEFPTAEGGKEAVLVMREEFRVEDSEGKVLARRMQVPLVLAWAMSIHKSQGQTIQRVKVDLGKVFEKGQSYVALSRAATLEGLQVLRFDPKKVLAHSKVIEWSKTLAALDTKGATVAS
ncbi:hypothetical protein BV22DRAFT_1047643 [Leucogyrophana mollusca]|uniref:Uncharacterized protein n=1 Tax=Leucogyrophana mollusca TaxID=85980 RepID=A0ACB8BFY9_9AGAM|nr:hypothetical protein BV22DRAFT_1047643 [Leucogyrophana mollusca]